LLFYGYVGKAIHTELKLAGKDHELPLWNHRGGRGHSHGDWTISVPSL